MGCVRVFHASVFLLLLRTADLSPLVPRQVKSNLNDGGDKGPIPICPGFGCSYELVSELHDALQARKVGRGNIAQIQQQELTLAYVKDLNVKVDMIMRHLNLERPEEPAHKQAK